jgi:hypothetical protein
MSQLRAGLHVAVILALFAPVLSAQDEMTTEGLEPSWLKTVVSIEKQAEGGADPVGTGFLVATPETHTLLVTAKHVLYDRAKVRLKGLGYRLNQQGGATVVVFDEDLEKLGAGTWFESADSDVACRFVAVPPTTDGVRLEYKQFLPKAQVLPGAPTLIPGFPMGLRSGQYAQPILRRG